jgi:cation transport ATPase
MGTSGKVTATEGGITIELMAKKDAPAAEKKTVKTDGTTTFFKADKGAETKVEAGDVKVGDHVMVTLDTAGTIATKVVIMPAHEKKKK